MTEPKGMTQPDVQMIVFPCADFGIYSLTAQKMDGGNDPMQLVV
jgi:hypothetical protein